MSDLPTLTSDSDEFELEVDQQQDELLDPFNLARDFNPLDETTLKDLKGSEKGRKSRTAIIRTSDRITYRRCRRMWDWTYSRRRNLQSNTVYAPFWLGSGLHFAFEDFHGYRRFPKPRDALAAYESATRATGSALPEDVDELLHLGQGMLDYYESWLETREPLRTFIVDGIPQVEVNFHVSIPKEHLVPYTRPGVLDLYDEILYSITIDRMIQDDYNRLWSVEYKSAKNYAWAHLETDAQVSAYSWGCSVKYPNHEIAGTVYQQHKKQILQPPAFLSSTRLFSTSKRQKTSYAMYLQALRNLYGTNPQKFPNPNFQFLEYLKTQESQDRDELIKRDYIERNPSQIKAEYQKILMEVGEMLDPNLPLYPNPTRDCSWQCAFTTPCVSKDAGEDWEFHLKEMTMSRTAPQTFWRNHLQYPQAA